LVELAGTNATAVLRPGTQSVVDLTPHHIVNEWMELTRINYNYNTKKYNYFYGLGTTNPDEQVAIPKPNKVIYTLHSVGAIE